MPVVLGALGVIAVIAAISTRHSGLQVPAHVFAPIPQSDEAVVVAAPRAADLVSTPIDSSDVA